MKKLMLIAAACVALASCVKNEVEPVVVDNSPIGFQAVQSLEQTRATLGEFTGTDFVSYAYLLQKGETWAADKADSQLFFAGQVVTESTEDVDGDGNKDWTTATPYYWPEQGSLTFYAYSPARITAPGIPSVAYDKMVFTNYNDDTYTNVDFMVADLAENRVANTVPTVFRHKLTKVGFQIAKKSNQDGRKIRLTKVEFNNLANTATFTQPSTGISGDETWTGYGDYTNDYVQWTGDVEVNVTASEVTLSKKLFIPQNLADDAEIKITYIVETTINGVVSEEIVVKSATFDEIHGAEANWNKNAYMVYTLTIGDGNKIYWAPVQYSWDDAITPGTTI